MIWDTAGPANTTATLTEAITYAKEHNIGWLVIASSSGATVRRALEVGVDGLSVVCVTHHVGFSAPGADEMRREERALLNDQRSAGLTTTHVLAGVDRTCSESGIPA